MSYSNMSHPELVQACLTSCDDPWKEFKARYDKVISSAVLRTAFRWGDTSRAVLEDLTGNVYVKLCDNDFELLRNFHFRNDAGIFAFLKVVATNVVHDYFRHIRRKSSGTEISIEELYESADPPIPAPNGPDDIERNVLMMEVEETLWGVTGPEGERDRTIFWLHFRHGYTAEEIAALQFGLTAKGVESLLLRVRNAVRARLTEKAAACAAAESKK
jgi:RNA polymerase sigma-70 factor (ECF subfamily)